MYDLFKQAKLFLKRYPSSLAVFALFACIMLGTFLLSLPIAQTVPMKFIDILFTSTSITTVTGLTTVPLQNFSTFGSIILLILMQIGGIGLMTMSLFILAIFTNMGIYTHVLARDLLSIESFKDTKRMLMFIIIITGITEVLGIIISLFSFYPQYSLSTALYLATFHAVSAFCNAGFTYMQEGIIIYNSSPSFMLVTTFLMVIGGLGFITLYDIIQWWRQDFEDEHSHPLSWHTKLILELFLITTLFAALLIWMLERNNSFKAMSSLQTLLNVIFLSVSFKSTGFISIAIQQIQLATVLLILISCFIGTAPASTGSGIKLSNFGIILGLMKSALFAKDDIEIHGRKISTEQVYKSMAIIMIFITWIISITFFLLMTEKEWRFIDIFFETVSAFCGSGLTLGLTPHLSIIGKVFIIFTMIAGRIGSLIIIMGIKRNLDPRTYSYPEEKVILG